MPDKNTKFRKAIGKAALAEKYEVHPTTLMRWINASEKLKDELYELDYEDNQKVFYPQQLELIFKYLGEPGE